MKQYTLLSLVCAVTLVARGSVFAAPDTTMRSSDWGLQVGLDASGISLASTSLGIKWWIGQKTALRASLNISGQSTTTETKGVTFDSSGGTPFDNTVTTSSGGVVGSAVLEFHMPVGGRLSPYVPAGVTLGVQASSDQVPAWTAGLVGGLGLQYQALPWLALSFEEKASITYNHSGAGGSPTNSITGSTIRYATTTSNLMVTVYMP